MICPAPSLAPGAHRSAAVGDLGALPSSALAGRVVDFVSRLQAHTGWSSDHILAVIAQVGGSVDAGAAGSKATAMPSSLHGDQEVAGGGGASCGVAAVAGAAGGLKQSPSMSKFHRRMRTPDWVDAEVQALNASALGGAPYDCDGSVVVGPGHATTLVLDHVSVGVAAAGAPPSSVKGRAAAASTTAALVRDAWCCSRLIPRRLPCMVPCSLFALYVVCSLAPHACLERQVATPWLWGCWLQMLRNGRCGHS